MVTAVRVEGLKLRRSAVCWWTAAIVGIGVPALTAGFVAAARGPAEAPLAIKVNAMLIGQGWAAYLGLLAQVLSVAMLLGAGMVVAWCFGREFTDHTVTDLFALATSRPAIAAAKCVVVFVWAVAVTGLTLAAAVALAPVAGLPGVSINVLQPAGKVLIVGVSGALLAYPLAFLASVARGYLPAVGGLILVVVATQVLTVAGVGAWFPYAASSLWAGMGGAAAAAAVGPHHLLLIPVTGAAGIVWTIWWWGRMQVL